MNNIKTVKIKDFTTGDGSLTLFGGPCTAEGLELCRRVAGFLAPLCADLGINYVFKSSSIYL